MKVIVLARLLLQSYILITKTMEINFYYYVIVIENVIKIGNLVKSNIEFCYIYQFYYEKVNNILAFRLDEI